MKKIIILFVTLWTQLLSSSIIADPIKTIRFATEATYPPFEFIDESGQIRGFDIDIATTLCQEMKVQCTFSNQSFNSLLPSLKLGKFDALIAAIGITPKRQNEVSFTHAYYEPSASFVAMNASHYSLSNLHGKTIGVQQGSVFEKYLYDKYRDVTIKTYASVQDAFLDLILGRLDAVLTDTPIAITWLKQDKKNAQYNIIDHPIIDHSYFGTGYGIAVRKNDVALLTSLNKALAEIKANGKYEIIIKKYFGTHPG